MIRPSMGLLALLVAGACVFAPGGLACTIHEVSTQGGEKPFDEAPMLAHLADAVALPMFRAAATESAALAVATAALEAAPTPATLSDAQAAWRRARTAWTRTLVWGFGPAKDLSSRIDWWPTDAAKIEARIAGDAPIEASTVTTTGASERGFGAIELLLFGQDGDLGALARLQAEPRRGALARALADDLAGATRELQTAWEPSGGNFAGELSNAGAGSTAFPARKNATDAIVNESIFAVELVLGSELALPLGLRNDGTPQPASVRSGWSDASIDDALGHLWGVEVVYRGAFDPDGLLSDGEGGLSDLVLARGDQSLDDDLREAFERTRWAIAAIPPPLRTAVVNAPQAVQRAHDEVRELKRLLATDVATAVGTTLSFNDNDGD